MTEFDWVKARYACTAASEFTRLADAVCKDMKARIEQDEDLKHVLDYCDRGASEFAVRKQRSHEIVFKRVGETIEVNRVHVSGSEQSLLVVTVGMNEDGECTLQRGAEELHPWQVRRMALEETFFGTTNGVRS